MIQRIDEYYIKQINIIEKGRLTFYKSDKFLENRFQRKLKNFIESITI